MKSKVTKHIKNYIYLNGKYNEMRTKEKKIRKSNLKRKPQNHKKPNVDVEVYKGNKTMVKNFAKSNEVNSNNKINSHSNKKK